MEDLQGLINKKVEEREIISDNFVEKCRFKIASWSLSNTFLTVVFLLVLAALNSPTDFLNLSLIDFLIIIGAFIFSSLATFKIIKTANCLPDKGKNMYPVAPSYFYQGTIFCALFWFIAGIFTFKALS